MVKEINQKLKDVLPTGLFLCACFIEMDFTDGKLKVWNGGLPDVLIIGEGGIKRRLPSVHVPLSVVSNEKLDTSVEIMEVAQGNRIYVYTDGVIDATNKEGEMFGQQRLEEHFSNIQEHESLFDEICSSHAAFRSGGVQDDDIAMIEIRSDEGDVLHSDGKTISEPKDVSKGCRLTLELRPDDFRKNDILPRLMEMLMGAERTLLDQKQNIYLILSELFSNALDYGILSLNSGLKEDPEGFEEYFAAREKTLAAVKDGLIKLDFELFKQEVGGKLVIRVEDSGHGFDYEKTLPAISENLALGGRGIPLVRSLCQELVYQGIGNQVKAVYVWE